MERFLQVENVSMVFETRKGRFTALHDIDLIERYATRVVALRDGRLVFEGQPESFDGETFRQIYGEEAEPTSQLSR